LHARKSFLSRLRVAALVIGVSLTAPSALRAQGTGLVPPSDLAYVDIDRLGELGVLDSVIIGQRPYSRREIARIARVARVRLDGIHRFGGTEMSEDAAAYAEGLVHRLETRFSDAAPDRPFDGWVVAFVDGASLTFNSTDADRRGFPAPYSRLTEATIDPLAERRLGQPAVRGNTGALELSNRIEPTSWLAIQARERVEYRSPHDTTITRTTGELLLASARAVYRNAALTVGREEFTWAQTADQGLFLASDAPALDQISLTGDHPFVLPSFLKLLGPTQATLIFADLGASVQRSHSKLLTYKVSVQPSRSVELGGTFMNHFGGTGSRSSSFGDRLIDFLPFVDVFRKHNYSDTTRVRDVESDKLLGLDGRFRFARLGGLLLTGELLIDDFDVHRLPKLLTGYGSQTFAMIIPELGWHSLSAKLTAKHMGILTYTHNELANGITTRGRLLGDELGPDSKSYSGQFRWTPASTVRFELEGRSAIYSNATYTSFYTDPAQTQFVVQKVSSTPNELRDLLLGSLILESEDAVALTMRTGFQRIRNASFQGGRRRDYVAEIALRIGQ
jgi:hypothetical protein